MTTVKNIFGARGCARFLSLLLIFACVFCFCSCSALSENPLQDLELFSSEASEDTEKATAYRIVLPSMCGGELVSAAEELASAMTRKTGVPAYTLFDYEEDWNQDEGVREILLGRTSRLLSEFYLSELNRDDYRCLCHDGTLILGGLCDSATIHAIEVFCADYLPSATAECLMPPNESVLHTQRYAWAEAKVNSFNIKDYTIVYPRENIHREYTVATMLREKIADLCGAYPPICSDEDFDGMGRAILVGACFDSLPQMASQTAYLSANGERILLYAPDSYGLSYAANVFFERLFPTSEGSVASLRITETLGVFYDRPAFSMLNLLSEWTGALEFADIDACMELILSSDAELITLGRMERVFWTHLSGTLPKSFETKAISLEEDTVLPIVFRSDSVLLTEEPSCHELNGSRLIELSFANVADNAPITVFYLLEENMSDDAELLFDWVRQCYEGEPSCFAVVLDLSSEGQALLEMAADADRTVIGRTCVLKTNRRVLAVLPVAPALEVIKTETGDWSSSALAVSHQISVLARAFVS